MVSIVEGNVRVHSVGIVSCVDKLASSVRRVAKFSDSGFIGGCGKHYRRQHDFTWDNTFLASGMLLGVSATRNVRLF